jgi:hypothetical protein
MRNNQNKRMRNNRNNHGHNNNNNNRRGQNPMTRVYESNGPDIKIRGTASHLAEKYVQLARDAQGSGDPVAAENYYQHAEHYFRIIAAAQEQFRQNQPQTPRAEGEPREDGDEGEDFGFGNEPGFSGQREPSAPAPYPARAPQPYLQREPRDQQPRDQQPRDTSFRENRPQSQAAPVDEGDIERLPSFITGGQPAAAVNGEASPNGAERPNGERGDRFPYRRRRRHPGPRTEGSQAAPADDFGPTTVSE